MSKQSQFSRQVTLYRYQLPMDSGVIVREQRLLQREGYIIELYENEHGGLGECAPLPTFSYETLEQVEAQLLPILSTWQKTGEWPDFESLFPSVSFGLSAAKYELEQTLPQAGEYLVAPLCSGDPDELIPVFQNMADNDRQKVAKVKVGLYEPIRDGMLVNLFLESIPELNLRLDANRSWSLDKALKFAQYVTPELRRRITFLEEPCHTPDLSLEFARQTGIKIAWDETLQETIHTPKFNVTEFDVSNFFNDQLGALVIKPTLIGSIDRCIRLIDYAKAQGLQVVISSSLESTIGLTQLARLSAWQTPHQTPGLDTLQLFQSQLERSWPNSVLPMAFLSEQALIWRS
ncbi:o-succinylbenzoate synthase [Vibrio casei]|uniref:o-succinylbenzoate synthase n=1 Tax=Vibrio casei TaxID=673372 RepID=A0A368LLZ7_9VIBR|nr:o-succinylbenzoate synthase [Vibrio casei]RCS72930.1 o-succinylbenzoate synthase [Vibrio casei]SJN32451.1 O-succinylbenzoate synthase [Vibrio casei]